jgi:hypothetical protein
MKREIICPECYDTHMKPILAQKYPGESSQAVIGYARDDFVCDQCATSLESGAKCVAISIWRDRGPNVYFEWESQYLMSVPKKKAGSV